MKDRQPGAPGQYKAVITAAEQQKMQAGEAFVITMTRDDQPLVEGTPYNKASVLPDDLAELICPDVLDPTPADALRALYEGGGKAKAGFIYPLAAAVVPEGFLLCDGAAYLRSEYPELFAAIGTIYGPGDGSTTFNVPDLRGRVPAGAAENHPAGEMVGEEAHQLTKEELPSDMGTNGQAFILSNRAAAVTQTYTADGVSNQSGFLFPDAVFKDRPHNNMQPTTFIHGYIIATGKGAGVSVADIILGAQAIPLSLEYGGVGATDPKTARENLEITPENIGALSMELLWENASPSSEFAPQTISLNLAKRSGVIVGFAYYTSLLDDIHRWYEFCPIGKGVGATYQSIGSTGEYGVALRRKFSVNDNGVVFGDGAFQQGTVYSLDNARAIPLEIYAV